MRLAGYSSLAACFSPLLTILRSLLVSRSTDGSLSPEPHTLVADRPVCSAVLACFLAGSILLVLGKFGPHLPKVASPPKQSIIPLAELEDRSREPSPVSLDYANESRADRLRSLSWWKKIALVSAIGCIRVEFYRETTLNAECAPTGYAYTIPFLVSLYDYWRNQRRRTIEKSFASDSASWGKLRILASLCRRTYSNLCQSRPRYVIASAFLLAGGLITSWFPDGRESTFICPITFGLAQRLHFFKVLDVFLDLSILIGAAELSRDAQPQEARKQTHATWGCGLLVSCHCMCMEVL